MELTREQRRTLDVSAHSLLRSVDLFVEYFASLRWLLRPSGWFVWHRVDDIDSVVTFVRHRVDDVPPVVRDLDHSVCFVPPFRWFVVPVGFSRRQSVGDLDPFRFVVRPTCSDARRSVSDLWNRRVNVESVDDDLDRRRREPWNGRWFPRHSVIAEPPVVTTGPS